MCADGQESFPIAACWGVIIIAEQMTSFPLRLLPFSQVTRILFLITLYLEGDLSGDSCPLFVPFVNQTVDTYVV